MKRFAIAITLLTAGCQTQFTGDPHISAAACQAKCQQDGLAMTGLVHMGEYSSACICEIPRAPGGPGAPTASSPGAVGAAAGAAAGVVMQMRRSQSRHNSI